MGFRSTVVPFTLVAFLSCESVECYAGLLHWTQGDSIRRSSTDGTGVTTVLSVEAGSLASGIAVESVNGHIYWTESGTSDIHRADLSGSNVVTLFDSSSSLRPSGIAVDASNGRMYWGEINRVAYDDINPSTPSNPSTLYASQGLGVAITDTHVYWATGSSIRRAGLDGSNPIELVTNTMSSWGVAIDEINNHLYWTARGANIIERANLDGSNRTTVISGANASSAKGITLDLDNQMMFWINADTNGGDVFRASLLGSGVTSIVKLDSNAAYIAFSPTAVPEPTSLALSAIGLGAGLLLHRFRRRRE